MQPKRPFGTLAKKRLIIESFIAFMVLLAPFIYKFHEYFPDVETTESVDFLWFTVGKLGFPTIAGHAWFFLTKFIPFYLLLIWFFTCRHWWYHIILIPLIMYAFQIFELYTSENNIVDSKNVLWLLPVCIIVIPFVYFIRLKLYDKHVHGIDLEAMDTELKILKEKEALRKEREKLEQRKTTLSKKM